MTTFRLASVLRLRRTLREQSEVRAAEAHHASRAAASLAARRHDELRAAALASGSARMFQVSVSAIDNRASSARGADDAAEIARAMHRQRIDELVRASMDVSALERLEERAIEAARAEERKREGREIDDLVTARFARRAACHGEVAP